ncbi:ankyrin repeat protein [Aneurinibacillus soli]|uniref:Ankyrin repeats (3 copies) n=1 Tax=Aneurinibacillus soli TaxID=1500254 RepID=A0A0U5BCL5_9BACL|nr:stalk domain-containing protein [Aneurinibacillus soli]PYE63978.1 ankyrin repeat protein [Aneurinibacillus soli]BAU27927.1 Ankyrin repeats (3 copies) [Aneurinibacillus soli]
MKKIVPSAIALSLALTFAASPAALAQPNSTTTKSANTKKTKAPSKTVTEPVTYTKSLVTVYSNNKKITFPRSPVVVNDVLLVPMRDMFNSIGATVYWDDKTRTITAQKGNDKVILKIGKKSGTKNGKAITFSTAPEIINGTTMVPVRLAAESFDLAVTWDAKKKAIFIQEKNSVSTQPKPAPTQPAETTPEPDKQEQANLAAKLLAMQLAEAVASGSTSGVRTALNAGANPNTAPDNTGVTPLMSAISGGKLDIARILLTKKADPNIQNDAGKTALMYAIERNNIEAINLLLSYKADRSAQTKLGEDALSLAYKNGSTDVARLFSSLSFREAATVDELRNNLTCSVIDGISANDLGLSTGEAVMYVTLSDQNALKTFRALSDEAKKELIYSVAFKNWSDVTGASTCRVLIRFEGRTLLTTDLTASTPLSAVKWK